MFIYILSSNMKIIIFSSILVIAVFLQSISAELPLTLIGGRYYYYGESDKNWQGASDYCVANNLQLASFETRDELTAVSNWMIHHDGFPNNWQIWTSGNDHSGAYRWTATDKPLNYNAWAPGQPDNYFLKEHCMTAWHHTGQLRFNDHPCTANLQFMCEKP